MKNIIVGEEKNLKKNKTSEIRKDIIKFWVVTGTVVSLILALNNNNNNNQLPNDINYSDWKYKWEPKDELFYKGLRNQLSFSSYWFLKTIVSQNHDLKTVQKLQQYENFIIKASNSKIEKGISVFSLNLNINKVEKLKKAWLIDRFVFLLDSLYWEWYSNILTDWNDHSDKEIVIDIMEVDNKYILREIKIWDSSQEVLELEEEKINNSEIKDWKDNNKIIKA